MSAGHQGTQLPPHTIKKIISLRTRHLRKGGRQLSMGRIAEILKLSPATVNRYINIYESDPDSLMKLIGEDTKMTKGYRDLKHGLLHDLRFIEKLRGLSHHPLYDEGWRMQDEEEECLIAWPRGSGKSKNFVQNRVLQIILRSVEADRLRSLGLEIPPGWIPSVSIAIIGAEDGAAESHGKVIKSLLERKCMQAIWGPFKGAKWSQQMLDVAQRTLPGDDPTLLCAGIGSKILVGKHPDYIFFDDVVSLENTRTEAAIQRLRDQLGMVVEGMKKPNTKVCYTNTPYRKRDPISVMIAASKGDPTAAGGRVVPTMVVSAITDDLGKTPNSLEEVKRHPKRWRSWWPEFRPLMRSFSQVFGKVVPGYVELWEHSNGPNGSRGSFEAQQLMDTSVLDEKTFDVEMLRLITRAEANAILRNLEIYQMYDAAWSKRPDRRSDWHCVATIGYWRKLRQFYILHLARSKDAAGTKALKTMIRMNYDEWKPRKIWVELTNRFADEVSGLINEPELKGMNWCTFRPGGKKGSAMTAKKARAIPMLNEMEMGRVFVVADKEENWWPVCKREMEDFPNGNNDDQIDAICQGIIRILWPTNVAPLKNEGISQPISASFGAFTGGGNLL